MAFNQEQFDALVNRLEGLARRQPAIYKLRVGLLAVLGYGYIFLVLGGLLAAFGLVVVLLLYGHRVNVYLIKFALLALVPALLVVRSLWVSFPPPTGLPLSRKQVPYLFALVDELTAKLKAPRFHQILLTEDFNAGVVQRPRLGIFGWQQNYLIVGLPLMQSLSAAQFRAVLAHELGHLSGNHSRFAGWIYRIRKTYVQLVERLAQGGHAGSFVLFEKFFNWYAPFFSAYSFVLARMDEYEADRCASQLAGVQNTAEALINIEIRAKFLESSFWPDVLKQVHHLVEPPPTTFTGMFSALRHEVKTETATEWFEAALAQKTNNQDTHPCLADRLSALGYVASGDTLPLPVAIDRSAAEQFLGKALNQFTEHFDRSWQEQVATPWRQRYAYAQEKLQDLQALEEKVQTQPLTDAEAWNRAAWTLEFHGEEAGIPLLHEILRTQPDHAAANYALGDILLQRNDATGIDYIEQAIAKDPDSVIAGCELIYGFWHRQGKLEPAKAYQKRAEQHYELVGKAQYERSFVRASDSFEPHNLPDTFVQELSQQLSGYPRLKAAYLVQKVVQYFPHKPFYVLGVIRDRSFVEVNSDQSDQALVDQIANEVTFPSNAYVIILNNNTKQLGKLLRQVQRAAIYQK